MAERDKDCKVRIILTPEQRAQIQQVAGTEVQWVEVSIEEELAPQVLEERVAPAADAAMKIAFN